MKPGLYDINEADYHADKLAPGGSLSSTEVKRLLDCPARYRYWKDNGPEQSDAFDFGKAAHARLLGVGAEIDVLGFDDWRTKDARAARDESRDAGRVPVLTKEWAEVEAMIAAVRAHPTAARLLDPDHGTAETSAFWHDRVWRRARFDFRPDGDRAVIVDYKTSRGPVSPDGFARAVKSYGYDVSAAWYCDGLRAVRELDQAPAFVFVVQEKDPPYLVSVYQLPPTHIQLVRAACEHAVDIYEQCTASGHWPSYNADGIELIDMPEWAAYRWEIPA